MKKFYLAILATFFYVFAFSQTDISIGSGGTTGNTGTTYPCPIQDFYEGSRSQYLYLASELTNAGMAPGNISAIKFNALGLNSFLGSAEQITIKMGLTATASLTNNTWETGTNTVFGPIDDTVVLGVNTFTFTAPFFWNGSDNIVVEICNGDPNNGTAGLTTYTQNPSFPWTTGLSFNGSHTYRADNLGYLCGTATTSNSGTQTTRPDITFEWTVASTAGCYLPSGTAIANILATSASASWNPPAVGSTVTQYNWELRSSGAAGSGSTGLVASGNTATLAANFTGLTPSTNYYFYVKSDCGSGNVSVWSSGYNFVTACAPIPSFSENFNAVTIPNIPLCWSKILRLTGTSTATITTITGTNARSAPNAVSMYNSNSVATDDIILASPPLSNLSAGTYQLSFYAKNSIIGQDIEIGTLSDNTPTATFSSLQTVTVTTAYQKFNVSFAGYTGSDTYIGIRRINANTFSYVYIDDINWELIPSCVEPNTLLHSNITSTTAQLDWSPPVSSSPTSYDVYYATTKTPPVGTTTPSATGITLTTYNFAALTPSTKYFAWVRSNCGTVAGVSQWSDVDSFLTACVGVPTFSENFNTVTTPVLPLCWSKLLRINTTGSTANVTTISGTNAYSAPNAVSMYNGSSTVANNDDVILVSPPVSNLAAGTYQLSFYAKNSILGQDLEVGTLDDNSATGVFSSLQTVTVTTAYQKFVVSFSSYTGTDKYIALRRICANTFSYVYVDDIKWELIPSCVEPNTLLHTNLTISSAQIDWSAPSSSTPASYDLYSSTSNTAPNGTTTPTATGVLVTTYNLTGLLPATKYFVWVRSNCGTGVGLSQWSSADSFYTPCTATNVPYTQDFESVTVPALPNCTANENVGTGNNWITANSPGNGFTSKTLEYLYNFSNPADVWFYTQGLNLTAGQSYRVTFRYGNNSTTYLENLNVSYGTSPTSTDMTNLIVDYPSFTGGVAKVSATDFTPATSGVYYVGFHAYSIANQFNLYVDDISVVVTPLCNEPTALVTSNLTATGAQIDWTAPAVGTPSTYEMYYSTNRTKPADTATATVNGITATTYTLAGLSSATYYYAWVRSNCGTGSGKSVWSVVDSFITACVAVPVFSENFSGVTTPALPTCWSKLLRINTTGSIANVTTVSGTNANTAPNAISMYNSSSTVANNDDIILVSPPVSNLAAGTYQLSFYAKNSILGQDLEVGTLDDNSATGVFSSLQTVTVTTAYQKFVVSFSGYSGTDKYIALRRICANTFSYVYVDDIKWELIPSCVEPSGLVHSAITTNSAKLDWTAPSSGTPASYEVYQSTSNMPPTSTTTPTALGITGTTYNLTSLNAATLYFVWVRANCGTGGVSGWSVADSFYTACLAAATPYIVNFENATVPNLPPCTAAQNLGSGNIWKVSNNPGYGFTNKTMQYTYNTASAADTWFYTQGVSLTGGVSYRLRFYYGNNSATTFTESMDVKYGSSADVAAMTNPIVDYPAINGAAKDTSITDFTPIATGTYYFGFHAYSISNQFYLFVDDISVDTTPALPVRIVTFKGEREGARNMLAWATASEQNCKGYELQRSSNGESFSTVAYVSSKATNGNSNNTLNYSYADAKPFTGNNYYRLKQVDFDGKPTLSNVVLIKGTKVNSIALSSVYPNPARHLLNVVLAAPASDKVSLIVTDLAGKVIIEKVYQLINGDNKLVLNVADLLSGTYMVKAVCNNGCETAVSKFVKQ